jgi:hypothetical protein
LHIKGAVSQTIGNPQCSALFAGQHGGPDSRAGQGDAASGEYAEKFSGSVIVSPQGCQARLAVRVSRWLPARSILT